MNMKEIFSDSNIILWHESGVNKTKQNKKTKQKTKKKAAYFQNFIW